MKKFFSLIITTLLVLSIFAFSVSAEGVKIKADTVTAKVGDTVCVDVVLTENSGIAALKMTVDYDRDALSLTDVKDAGKLGAAFHNPNYSSYPYVLFWNNATSVSDITYKGVIATLTFKVKSGAKKTNEIKISVADGDVFDYNLNSVPISVAFGAVNLADNSSSKLDVSSENATSKITVSSDKPSAYESALSKTEVSSGAEVTSSDISDVNSSDDVKSDCEKTSSASDTVNVNSGKHILFLYIVIALLAVAVVTACVYIVKLKKNK